MQSENSVMQSLSQRIAVAIESLRAGNSNFEHAHETYVQQYGRDVIAANEPLNFEGTIDPVVLILGQTSFVQFRDSTKELRGPVGSIRIEPASAYIIGRRQPQDSKLVIWNSKDGSESELEEYNARSSIIPSRIHGAFVSASDGNVVYTDLCSSSGTVIFGELKSGGPFVRIYDPGSEDFPRIKVTRINTARKS
jgi:hypothetical protein